MVDDQRIKEEARKAIEEHNRNHDKNTKQKSLLDMWGKKLISKMKEIRSIMKKHISNMKSIDKNKTY